MIPAFDLRGLLPPYLGVKATTAERSPYATDSVELVLQYGTSAARRKILKGFLAYRAELAGLGYTSGLQLIDGSFVEHIEIIEGRDPGDIDVFSFLQLPAVFAAQGMLDLPAQDDWDLRVVDRDRNKLLYAVDSYGVLVEELSFYQAFTTINYWTSLFSHRRGTAAWKGFLVLPLNASRDADALTALAQLEADHA